MSFLVFSILCAVYTIYDCVFWCIPYISKFWIFCTEAGVLERVFGIVTIHLAVELLSWMFLKYKRTDCEQTRLSARRDCGVQTTGAWRKLYRIQKKQYEDQNLAMKLEWSKARRSGSRIYRKYKIKASSLQCDIESKAKLVTCVKSRVISLAFEVDSLIHRIQEKRLVLDRQREENRTVLQRYEELYHDFEYLY